METEIYNWFCNIHHIKVPKDWLAACLTWLQDELHTPRNELRPSAYEQWLIANLKEIGAQCLVSNLSNMKSTILKGYFALQIDSIQDISKPSYQQLLKLEGKNHTNAEVSADNDWKTEKFKDKNRMLKLNLTDGDQEIFGLEYQPIPSLNLNLPIGTKVLIYGEIMCRNGSLLLKEDNVKVLGGEVAELAEIVNPLILLRNKLNLSNLPDSARIDLPVMLNTMPTNTSHPVNDENRPRKQKKLTHAQSWNILQPSNSTTNKSNTEDIWSDGEDEIFDFVQPSIVNSYTNDTQSSTTDFGANSISANETPRSSTYNTSNNLNASYADYSLDSDEEFESLLNSARTLRQQGQKSTIVITPQNHNMSLEKEISTKYVKLSDDSEVYSKGDSDEEFESLLNSARTLRQQGQKPMVVVTPQNHNMSLEKTISNKYVKLSDDSELYSIGDSDEEFENLVLPVKNVPSTPPFIYIDTLPSLPLVYYFKAVIKGFVISFLSGLRTTNHSLSMDVLINDGSGSIKASLSNEVIFNLIGMPFKEFETLKKASKLNLEAQKAMANVLAQFQRKVIDLSCLFEIEAPAQSTTVTVINLIEVSRNAVEYFENFEKM